jgi:hypothetical protein
VFEECWLPLINAALLASSSARCEELSPVSRVYAVVCFWPHK